MLSKVSGTMNVFGLSFVLKVIKISFNSIIFTSFRFYRLHCFIDFEHLSVILGGFLTFWKKFEIQDSGSKMAAVLTSQCNCHGM